MSVRQQLEILVKLQGLDREIQKVVQMLDSVPGKIDSLDAEVEAQSAIVRKDKLEIDALQKTYRSLESDMNANAPKIEKSKGRLSTVKTNKEYQSLLKEIDDLTLINSELEDRMLGVLEQMDALETRLKENKNKISAFKNQADQDKAAIQEAAQKAQLKLDELQQERQRVRDTAAPDFLTKFIQVRQQVGNIAIAGVVNAVCGGCNTNIPPQMFNELQRCDQLMMCPHCQRIIYSESNG